MLIKDIQDIDLDICMSKYYEVCFIYHSKLEILSILSGTTKAAQPKTIY